MDKQFAPVPITNRSSGVYPAGTTISLNANLTTNQNIYYTLDGTDPRPPDESNKLDGTVIIDENNAVRVFVQILILEPLGTER